MEYWEYLKIFLFVHFTIIHLLLPHLLVPLLVQQLAQIVQAGGHGALVGVRVLQVLVWDVGAGQEGALGLVQPSQIHQDDSRVQVGRWRWDTGWVVSFRRMTRISCFNGFTSVLVFFQPNVVKDVCAVNVVPLFLFNWSFLVLLSHVTSSELD